MNTPSIKTLTRVFGANAKEAKRLLVTCAKIPYLCNGKSYVNTMEELNGLAGTYGVEYCKSYQVMDHMAYLNTGDSDKVTLTLWEGQFRVQSVSDFLSRFKEFQEPQHYRQHNLNLDGVPL